MSRRFGWHSGALQCRDITVDNDMSIEGDLSFGDASTDTLTVTGIFTQTITSKSTAGHLIDVSGRDDVTTGYETMMKVSGILDSTGSAGGVKTRGLHIDLERTSATVANGDSRDTALMINIKDSVGDHTAGYFIRAMDVKAEFDSAGTTLTNMYAAQFTAEVDNGTSTDYMCATFNSKVDGTVTNDAINVRIYDESQGTVSGDHIGLQFATKNVAPASGQRNHVIEVDQSDSSGWLNLFHLTDATNGYTCVKTGAACDTDGQDSDAAIRIDIDGTAYYVPAFNAAHTSSSW